jgi:hypothetical protein
MGVLGKHAGISCGPRIVAATLKPIEAVERETGNAVT